MRATQLPTPAAPSVTTVCAVVVAYFPDQGFEARLRTILPQVARLVVVDNTPTPTPLSADILACSGGRLCAIANHANKGVAAALNQGLEYALHHGYPWLLTLDQDTHCYSNMVSIQSEVYKRCSPRVAVVGSNYLDPRNHKSKVPTHGGEYLEQKTVITSGALVDAQVARFIGGFCEEFFIDQVDHEFCLRLRAHDYRIIISRKPAMEHSVGTHGGVRLPLLGVLPNHPPIRKYYIARNSLVTVAKYWRREPGWCIRRAVRLLFGLLLVASLENNRLAKIRAFVVGAIDGARCRMGPCGHHWLNRPKDS